LGGFVGPDLRRFDIKDYGSRGEVERDETN
jgi:hypothetical protein